MRQIKDSHRVNRIKNTLPSYNSPPPAKRRSEILVAKRKGEGVQGGGSCWILRLLSLQNFCHCEERSNLNTQPTAR